MVARGGLCYRSTLDPAKTYTVSIDGENVSGGFNLRVGKDGAFSWLAAPKGVKSLQIGRASCRERVWDRAGGASYEVKSWTVQECWGSSEGEPVREPYGAATVA